MDKELRAYLMSMHDGSWLTILWCYQMHAELSRMHEFSNQGRLSKARKMRGGRERKVQKKAASGWFREDSIWLAILVAASFIHYPRPSSALSIFFRTLWMGLAGFASSQVGRPPASRFLPLPLPRSRIPWAPAPPPPMPSSINKPVVSGSIGKEAPTWVPSWIYEHRYFMRQLKLFYYSK